MLNIGVNARAAFLSDSAKKQLNIEIDGKTIEEYNPYRGHISMFGRNINVTQGNRWYIKFNTEPDSDNASLWFDWSYVPTRRYVCVYLNIMFDNVVTAPDQITIRCYYTKSTGGDSHYVDKTFNTSEFSDYKQVAFIFDTLEYPEFTNVSGMAIRNSESTPLECTILYHGIQLDYSNVLTDLPMPHKDGIGDQEISVIPTKRFTNEDIAFESFDLTESLCSKENIKFGLCESASVKFDLMNKDYDVKGLTIYPSISCLSDDDYTKINWSQGKDPEEHSDTWRNANMSNAHWESGEHSFPNSEEKENGRIPKSWNWYAVSFDLRIDNLEMAAGSTAPSYMRIGTRLKKNDNTYIGYYTDKGDSYYRVSDLINGAHIVIYLRDIDKNYKEIDGTYFRFLGENKEAITGTIIQVDFTWSNVQINALASQESAIPEFNIDNAYAYNETLDEYFDSFSVPLGVYEITEVKTEHSRNMITKHITAYDNILKLEQNAANWYTDYMYCPNWWFGSASDIPRYGNPYPKQIYASFFNYAKSIGLEADDYEKELILDSSYNDTYHELVDFTKSTSHKTYYSNNFIQFGSSYWGMSHYTDIDKNVPYQVIMEFPDESIDTYYNTRLPGYRTNVDSLGRGVRDNASILILEIFPNNTRTKFSVNNGDYFMIDPDATDFYVYVPMNRITTGDTFQNALLTGLKIYKVTGLKLNLTNGCIPLRYYKEYETGVDERFNYTTFACESNITGRDVVRSLLEVCGCFFKLNRETGKPQFVYCTKSGLYPSNTLYPADDLYPRGGVDGENVPMGKYMSLVFDDYTVKDYGRIQIVKKIKSNESNSVVEWEYTGNENKENTYLIEDNIFYCAEEMEYEYDSMYDVSKMLENMYNQISNMGYIPNTVVALGMPWLECGDRIGLMTEHAGAESFVFRRTLTGIQMLTDTIESTGDECNEAVKEYGYIIYGG